MTLATAAILLVAAAAHAVDPTIQCQDGAGKASAKYFQALMKAANTCYASKADGTFIPILNCSTQFADPSLYPFVSSENRLQKKVLAEKAKLESKFTKACGVVRVDFLSANFGFPCNTASSSYFTDSVDTLDECVIQRAHGIYAAHLQSTIYGDAPKIDDPAARACQKSIGKILTKLASAVMKVRRSCGRQLMAGKTCDPQSLDTALTLMMSNATSAIVSSCSPAAVSRLTFGFNCAGTFATPESAAACLTSEAVTFAWYSSDTFYQVPQ